MSKNKNPRIRVPLGWTEHSFRRLRYKFKTEYPKNGIPEEKDDCKSKINELLFHKISKENSRF